ncbi:acyltransferase [Vreelandella profundi]|uniref:acyltransferase n=1 Tax=Vreelandella profundi TaxID=2852117 RepID=UPI001F3DEB2C|nr:acyltransferase [Halomonas profundi]
MLGLLNLLHKRKALSTRIRGVFYNIFLLKNEWSKGLRVSNGVDIWGGFKIGDRVFLGKNVKIYRDVQLGSNNYIGDSVEFRCNGQNKICVGDYNTFNKGSLLIGNVKIGSNCLIAPLCVIVGSNHEFADMKTLTRLQGLSSRGVVIADNVWLGAQVTVLDGVNIGANSVIGAGSVVTKDIPENSIAVGNPCKIIRLRA